MIDFKTITKEELEQLEEEREAIMPKMFIEGRGENIIENELRFNYGFYKMGYFLIHGQTGAKLELHVTDIQGEFTTKEIHLGYIGVVEKQRQQGQGHEIMNILTDLADKYSFDLNLDIDTKFGMKKSVLKKFYKSHGFVEKREIDVNRMERYCK
jgi:GNAT superfamily N-acetyltransferase